MSITQRMDQFFSPKLTLKKRGPVWTNDLVSNYTIFCQLRREAGITRSVHDSDLDKLGQAASNHGYSLELIEPAQQGKKG